MHHSALFPSPIRQVEGLGPGLLPWPRYDDRFPLARPSSRQPGTSGVSLKEHRSSITGQGALDRSRSSRTSSPWFTSTTLPPRWPASARAAADRNVALGLLPRATVSGARSRGVKVQGPWRARGELPVEWGGLAVAPNPISAVPSTVWPLNSIRREDAGRSMVCRQRDPGSSSGAALTTIRGE